jgi:solute carrier family 25 citrate transporter 1
MGDFACRFVVFNRCRDWMCDKFGQDASKPHVFTTAAAGIVAGTASVYGNTPIDVVKTRMQGLEAHHYTSSWDCFKKIVQNEGWTAYVMR